MGIVYAIIVSVIFSLYIIPRKFTKMNPVLYMAFLGLAFFVASGIFYVSVNNTSIGYNETLWDFWHLLSALQGILWFGGGVFLNIAIDKIGISKSNQWKNLQGPIGSSLMILFLGDVSGTAVFFVIAGIILILVSAALFTIQKEGENMRDIKSGILLAVLSAVLFGTNALLQKMLNNEGFIFSKNVYSSLFVLLSAVIYYLIIYRNPKDLITLNYEKLFPISAGIMYSIAAIFSVLAYNMIAGSVAFSIIQLNTFWTILIGIFIFKEIDFKKNWIRIAIGFIFAIGAVILLIFAL